MKKLAVTIASGLGTGLIPIAPGTWGTALAAAGLSLFIYYDIGSLLAVLVALIIICTAAGYWAIRNLPEDWVQDDQRIVIDEVLGMLITVVWLPLEWRTIVLGFILFRFFDILKPLGIRTFDRQKTDWAVLVDDMIAGVYANIVLRVIVLFLF